MSTSSSSNNNSHNNISNQEGEGWNYQHQRKRKHTANFGRDDEISNDRLDDTKRLVVQDLIPLCSNYRELITLIETVVAVVTEKKNNNNKSNIIQCQPQATGEAKKQADNVVQSKSSYPSELIHTIASYLVVEPVRHEEVSVFGVSSTNGQHELTSVLIDDDGASWWMSSSDINVRPIPSRQGRNRQQAPQRQQNRRRRKYQRGFCGSGHGMEWIDLLVTPKTTTTTTRTSSSSNNLASCRRISSVWISIPPLPMGPLSVRTFRIDVPKSQHANSFSTPQGSSTSCRNCSSSLHLCSCNWITVSPIYHVSNQTGYQEFLLPKPVDCQLLRVVCLSNQISRFLVLYQDEENVGEPSQEESEEEEEDIPSEPQQQDDQRDNLDNDRNDNPQNGNRRPPEGGGRRQEDDNQDLVGRNPLHQFNCVGMYGIRLS